MMMTMDVDDSTLLAYLDGALEHEADYARVEQALAHDERVRARLQALVEQTQALRRAYQDKLTEPLPPHLVAAILNAPLPAAQAAPEQAGAWQRLWQHVWGRVRRAGPGGGAAGAAGAAASGRTRPGNGGVAVGAAGGPTGSSFGGFGTAVSGQRLWQGAALAGWAALAALALGWWGGATLPAHQVPAQAVPHWAQVGAVVQDERVLAALQLAASAQVLRIGHDTLEVMASFERASGQYCREVQESRAVAVVPASQPGAAPGMQRQTLAVLCQTPERTWTVAFAASESVSAHAFVTASAAQVAALEAFYAQRGAPVFLTPEQERERLAAGWGLR